MEVQCLHLERRLELPSAVVAAFDLSFLIHCKPSSATFLIVKLLNTSALSSSRLLHGIEVVRGRVPTSQPLQCMPPAVWYLPGVPSGLFRHWVLLQNILSWGPNTCGLLLDAEWLLHTLK